MKKSQVQDETSKKVRALIAIEVGLDEGECHDSAKIIEDLHADSLDVVEIIMSLEEQFAVEIKDDDIDGLLTVGSLIEYIRKAAK